MKRAFGASCDRLNPEKYQRSLADPQQHHRRQRRRPQRAGVQRDRGRPAALANSVSPAQNDGSNGVIGDCSVAKKSVRSGSDSTLSSCSGRMKRSTITRLAANSSPISIRMSRARFAGNVLTRISVAAVPAATGMIVNGTTVRSAVA